MLERGLEKVLIVVRQQLVDLVLFVVAFTALLVDEDRDSQGQTDDGHHVTQQFPAFEIHDQCLSDRESLMLNSSLADRGRVCCGREGQSEL